MLFRVFSSQEEKRNFVGSTFIEIQFCKMSHKTKIQKLVAVNSIQNWQHDSLYINDEDTFYQEYSSIFTCGIYNNLESGTVDIFGINYYEPSLVESIIAKINKSKPLDYITLVEWLTKAREYNGFYILGI